jgi:hypothetical protein
VVVQTVEVPVVQQCYTASETVYDDRGYPIGTAEGYSCNSQAEAQANADAQADEVRRAHP